MLLLFLAFPFFEYYIFSGLCKNYKRRIIMEQKKHSLNFVYNEI